MLPSPNVERQSSPSSTTPQSSGYAILQPPFGNHVTKKPYHDGLKTPTSANPRQQTSPRPDPSLLVVDLGAETSYDAYGSATHTNGGGHGGEYTQSPSTHGHPWQPGFFKQLPWLGLLALVGTVLCTFAAVAVLVVSNGRPIDSWSATLQPTVYLSIFTALANILLTYALYQGIVISFWRKAGQGATLLELHQYWWSGSSFYGATRGIFRLTGLVASLAVSSVYFL